MAKIDRFAEAALRQKIIDALKIDLIGPVEPNEVMDQDPASEYLTGIIYAKSLADDLEFGEQEVGFDFAHEDDYSTGAEEENDDVVLVEGSMPPSVCLHKDRWNRTRPTQMCPTDFFFFPTDFLQRYDSNSTEER